MENILLIIHVVLSASIVVLVLLQQGKGAEAGASFGAGASQTVFGSSGNSSFFARLTTFLAVGLFATSLMLAIVANEKAGFVRDAGLPAAEVIEQNAKPVSNSDIPTTE